MAKRRPVGAATPSGRDSGPGRFPDAMAWALIFFATLIAYIPALRGGPIWDDKAHLTGPDLQSWHGLWRIWFELGATQQYYPLLHTGFWVQHKLWDDNLFGYHLVSILLHALSACLVVVIVRRLRLPGAWLAGLVFALHPVCVEAVAWVSEQKSTLSAVFYLASALAYLDFDRTRTKSRYFLALALFVLALLTKTVTATLPAALLVITWWQRGRLQWRRDFLPLLPWFALGIPAGLFTAWVERTLIGAQGSDFSLTLAQRCLLAGRVIWFYALKLVWPSNLTFIYPHWIIDPRVWWQFLFPGAVVALVCELLFLARHRRGLLAGFLFFAGTLFPVLGFFNVFPFLYSYVADHFQYLASLGIIVPAACGLTLAARHLAIGRPAEIVSATVLLLLLGTLTWRQAGMYQDAETLYRETLARNPECWMAHNNLANLLSGTRGQSAEAIAEYKEALRIKPDYAEAHYNLGNLLFSANLQDAIAEYQAALRTGPDLAPVHANLATALSRAGRLPEAVAEYRSALRLKPDVPMVHFNLANALSGEDAIAEYRVALSLQPDYPEAHYNLALALAKLPGRSPEAVSEAILHLEAALRLRPNFQNARGLLDQLR